MAGKKDGPGTSQYPGKYVGEKAKIKPKANPPAHTPNTATKAKRT